MTTRKTSNYSDHLPNRDKAGYLNAALFILPLCSVGMLVSALTNLGIAGNGGVAGWGKIALIAIGAFVVSYTIFRMAIEKSAPLATKGYKSALFVGGFSIAFVGATFFIATASGLMIPSVEELQLQDHNAAVVSYGDERAAQAGLAARLVPAIEANAADLKIKAACEIATSCVSGSGSGGYGTTARTLENLAARADAIVQQASDGLTKRDAILDQLDRLTVQMDEVLADEAVSIWERRKKLRLLDAELGRVFNTLDEAIPTALLAAYAQELRVEVSLPNKQAGDTINALLTGYAASLEAVLGGISGAEVTRPEFPAKTGALQTFEYSASFAPIILIAFLVDMLFPLALWFYTLKGLDWVAYENNPKRKRTSRARTDFDGLTEFQVMPIPPRSIAKKTTCSKPRTTRTKPASK